MLQSKRHEVILHGSWEVTSERQDVASDVGVNFKNVGVLSIESFLFHVFHYTFVQTKHQRKGY